jgi:hypothetical protein
VIRRGLRSGVSIGDSFFPPSSASLVVVVVTIGVVLLASCSRFCCDETVPSVSKRTDPSERGLVSSEK